MGLSALDVVVDVAAVYRLTRLLVLDDIADPLRTWVHFRALDDEWEGGYSVADRVLRCGWCCAVWVAGGVALLRWAAGPVWQWAAYALALSVVGGLVSPTEPHDSPNDS